VLVEDISSTIPMDEIIFNFYSAGKRVFYLMHLKESYFFLIKKFLQQITIHNFPLLA
jgi:hypothetical protein